MQPVGATCSSPLTLPHIHIHAVPSAENGLFSLQSHAVTQMPTLVENLSQVLLCCRNTLFISLCRTSAAQTSVSYLTSLSLFSHQKKNVNSVTCWVLQKEDSYMISVHIY